MSTPFKAVANKVKKLFFFKRGLQFKLRSEEHFAQLAIGVSGEIDPISGMIVNLADLIQWFEKFQIEIKNENFPDVIELLLEAQSSNPNAVFEVHHIYGQNHPYILRLENEKLKLQLSSFHQSEKLHLEIEIKDAHQLEQVLSEFAKENLGAIKLIAKVLKTEREKLISGQTFLEN